MNAAHGLISPAAAAPDGRVRSPSSLQHPLDAVATGASRFHRSIEKERRAEEDEDLPWHGRQEEVTAADPSREKLADGVEQKPPAAELITRAMMTPTKHSNLAPSLMAPV
ncbi:unnamed protein product [Heligmosomoides polygyrus]|uniref:Uncharacterized protein n=1 Tax=Heligmosomoides polygyrus TaxID=6339 RepID=A0A183FWG3_HELPZ|nr:unnamed protein product [Heligmosomoides polygyrus]